MKKLSPAQLRELRDLARQDWAVAVFSPLDKTYQALVDRGFAKVIESNGNGRMFTITARGREALKNYK